jgi:hypothetical protein
MTRTSERRWNAVAILVCALALVAATVIALSFMEEATQLSDDEIADRCTERVTKNLGAEHPSREGAIDSCVSDLEGLRATPDAVAWD